MQVIVLQLRLKGHSIHCTLTSCVLPRWLCRAAGVCVCVCVCVCPRCAFTFRSAAPRLCPRCAFTSTEEERCVRRRRGEGGIFIGALLLTPFNVDHHPSHKAAFTFVLKVAFVWLCLYAGAGCSIGKSQY